MLKNENKILSVRKKYKEYYQTGLSSVYMDFKEIIFDRVSIEIVRFANSLYNSLTHVRCIDF